MADFLVKVNVVASKFRAAPQAPNHRASGLMVPLIGTPIPIDSEDLWSLSFIIPGILWSFKASILSLLDKNQTASCLTCRTLTASTKLSLEESGSCLFISTGSMVDTMVQDWTKTKHSSNCHELWFFMILSRSLKYIQKKDSFCLPCFWVFHPKTWLNTCNSNGLELVECKTSATSTISFGAKGNCHALTFWLEWLSLCAF